MVGRASAGQAILLGMQSGTRDRHVSSVRDALRYVRGALDAELSLAEIAAVACMSPHHFHRAFRELTGRGVSEHVRTVRLLRAALRLRSTSDRVLDIALDAHYGGEDSFRRAFRKHFGVTPAEYRRQFVTRRETPMQEAAVGFVKIPVSDFGRARIFYRDTLGLTEEFAVEAYGWAQFATATVPICLYVPGQGGGARAPGGDTGIQLRVSDARAAYSSLAAADRVAGELQIGDDGTVGFTLRDPDGNTIHVAQLS